MSSHLSDIGFNFSEENYYDELIKTFDFLLSRSSREIVINDKVYLVLYLDGNIEFWLPVGENNTIDPLSFELHFNTGRWIDVINPSWVLKTDNEIQGLLKVWNATEDYPFNVKIPNSVFVTNLCKNKIYKAQVACFAESFEIFKNESEFHQKFDKIGEQSFIPIGQFQDEENAEESSRAWINGKVLSINKRINSYTNKEYFHIAIESYNETFDLLVDGNEGINVELGDIISATAWLSGKIRVRYEGDDFSNLQRLKVGNEKLKTLDDLYNILRKSWCKESAHPSSQKDWTMGDPSYGQCAITAMLVYDMFGGTIHRIRLGGGATHYFNCINGNYIDLTREQFDLYDIPIEYEPNEKMQREYCGKNANTKSRYDLLVKKVAENLK